MPNNIVIISGINKKIPVYEYTFRPGPQIGCKPQGYVEPYLL